MNKIVLAITAILALPSVLADPYDMMNWGSGMMGGGMMGFGVGGILALTYFVILSLVFSVIFWWAYNWIVPKEKKK